MIIEFQVILTCIVVLITLWGLHNLIKSAKSPPIWVMFLHVLTLVVTLIILFSAIIVLIWSY